MFFKIWYVRTKKIVEFPLTSFSLPCKDDEVELTRSFLLKATINHTGSLDSGHYKSATLRNKLWYMCNDNAILQVGEKAIVDESAYMLFFDSCWVYFEAGKVSLLTYFSGLTHPLPPEFVMRSFARGVTSSRFFGYWHTHF